MERPWEGIHSTWASTIATQLNQDQLPAEYFAMPLVTLGGGVQVDVGTFQTGEPPESTHGGVTTQIWAPPQPPLSVVVDFVSLDVYEVRVMQQMGGPKLRSAIELVSPANKDRASHRRAFAVRCSLDSRSSSRPPPPRGTGRSSCPSPLLNGVLSNST
jgi:hypothetical protein